MKRLSLSGSARTASLACEAGRVIRIAITAEAYAAIASTLPLGSVAVEPEANEKGDRYVWLAPNVVDRLRFLRGPGESYSEVILRIAAEGWSAQLLSLTSP
jgi:hypothetical protein